MGIYRRGSVYWARWYEDGALKRRSLGTDKRAEAERKFKALLSGDVEEDYLSFRKILRQWFQYQTPRSKPASINHYKVVRKRFSLAWGHLRPEEITTAVVEDFQESALQAGLHPRTINQQIGIALSAFRWAHERGVLETAPPKCKQLKLNGTRNRKYLAPGEVKRLLQKVREPRWQRLEVVVLLALYAGLRQQEIIWLTWDDVDLEDGWLHVRAKRGWSPKSASSERSIPIARNLAEFLGEMPRTSRRWVASPSRRGDRWCRRHIGRETRLLFKACDVDDGGRHTLHRLRGTFATTVLRNGGDLESLRDVLGHSNLSITAGYLAATSESKQRAIQGVSFDS